MACSLARGETKWLGNPCTLCNRKRIQKNISPWHGAAVVSSVSHPGLQHPSSDSNSQHHMLATIKACSKTSLRSAEQLFESVSGWMLLRARSFQAWCGKGSSREDVKGVIKNAKQGALVIPFAAAVTGAKGPSELFIMLNQAVYHFVNLYLLFLFIRVILSWFPAFDWERTIWRELRQVTDPYLNIFTGIVPPLLGAIDLTPLLGFFVLQALKGYLTVYTEDDIEAWW